MPNHLFTDKFTSHLKRALARAIDMASMASASAVEPTHILAALAQETGCLAAEILQKAKTGQAPKAGAAARGDTIVLPPPVSVRPGPSGQENNGGLSWPSREILLKAIKIAASYRHKYIGTEHCLAALVASEDQRVIAWWQEQYVSRADLQKSLQIVLASTSKFPDLTAVFRPAEEARTVGEERAREALEFFGRELTAEKVQANIDPLVGREQEIERLIQVLCRRYKNNPLLLGEAGVGKTAIVEGLAKKILEGKVPPILTNKKIYAVDLAGIVAGTMYRGEFEARFKALVEAAEQLGNIILFIDEIHTIIGAGSASGSLDAANMLKPALARGRAALIGATTLAEYKKYIESDGALERRFQPIIVEEPNEEETLAILAGVKGNYEKFHEVNISDEALRLAVKLSNRYLTEKLQPDKAIDVLDEAAARAKVARSQKKIWQRLRHLEAQLTKVIAQKKQAVAEEKYQEAVTLRDAEQKLRETVAALDARIKKQTERRAPVTAEDVMAVVSLAAKIPLGELAQSERLAALDLYSHLSQKIIGQERALTTVASHIRRAASAVQDPKKPLASFMFLGPSGVGKTETAKQLAALIFNDAKALIRLDMSEFSEGFTVSRLIGSPAGYVGYRDSNNFTDLVRKRPYSIILLDEIEKAHPEVFNILLQVLEDGRLSDATGRAVNFRNTIIIMTANVGLEEFKNKERLGFDTDAQVPSPFKGEGGPPATLRVAMRAGVRVGGRTEEKMAEFAKIEKRVRDDLKNYFRPEFLNRLDALVVFNPLTQEHLEKIAGLYAEELQNRLTEQGMSINVTSAALAHIAKSAFDPELGGRTVRRVFQDQIESELAGLVLEKGEREKKVRVDVVKGKLIIR